MRGYSGDEYVATAARREGSRREVMIRHRHWRESESEPDGAVARPMRGPTEHGACQHCAATNMLPA